MNGEHAEPPPERYEDVSWNAHCSCVAGLHLRCHTLGPLVFTAGENEFPLSEADMLNCQKLRATPEARLPGVMSSALQPRAPVFYLARLCAAFARSPRRAKEIASGWN